MHGSSPAVTACVLLLCGALSCCAAGSEASERPWRVLGQQEEVATLLRWVEERGGSVGPIAVAPAPALGGRAVAAARDVEEGEVLLRVPTAALLNAATLERRHAAAAEASGGAAGAEGGATAEQQVLEVLHELEYTPTNAMALALLWEVHRGEESPWAAFVASLPPQLHTPVVLPKERREELFNNTAVLRLADRRRRGAERAYHALMTENLLRFYTAAFDKALAADGGVWSLPSWLWSLSIVWSRSHSVAVGAAGSDDDRRLPSLVPGGDLFNAFVGDSVDGEGGAPGAFSETDASGEFFEYRAARPLRAGEEITVRYTASDAGVACGELLLDYGFCFGAHDQADVAILALHEWMPDRDDAPELDLSPLDEREDLLIDMQLDTPAPVYLQPRERLKQGNAGARGLGAADVPFPGPLLAGARVAVLNDEEFVQVGRAIREIENSPRPSKRKGAALGEDGKPRKRTKADKARDAALDADYDETGLTVLTKPISPRNERAALAVLASAAKGAAARIGRGDSLADAEAAVEASAQRVAAARAAAREELRRAVVGGGVEVGADGTLGTSGEGSFRPDALLEHAAGVVRLHERRVLTSLRRVATAARKYAAKKSYVPPDHYDKATNPPPRQ